MTLGSRESAELEGISSQPAYEAFLEAARAVEASALEECRADLLLVFQNVRRAVEDVLSQEERVARLPELKPEDLRALPQLVQGLAYAALQVRRDLQAASFMALFERAQQMRRKLRKAAEALAEAELLLDADAEALRAQDKGDTIEDCLALAALFRRNEARITGRSPVMAADVDEAEQIGAKLRAMLTPGTSTKYGDSPGRLLAAVELRDRFWTLLNQRYEVLWRCGAWLWGRQVDEHVPPLKLKSAPVPPAQLALARVEPRRTSAAAGVTVSASTAPATATAARRQTDPMRALHQKVRFLVRVGQAPSR